MNMVITFIFIIFTFSLDAISVSRLQKLRQDKAELAAIIKKRVTIADQDDAAVESWKNRINQLVADIEQVDAGAAKQLKVDVVNPTFATVDREIGLKKERAQVEHSLALKKGDSAVAPIRKDNVVVVPIEKNMVKHSAETKPLHQSKEVTKQPIETVQEKHIKVPVTIAFEEEKPLQLVIQKTPRQLNDSVIEKPVTITIEPIVQKPIQPLPVKGKGSGSENHTFDSLKKVEDIGSKAVVASDKVVLDEPVVPSKMKETKVGGKATEKVATQPKKPTENVKEKSVKKVIPLIDAVPDILKSNASEPQKVYEEPSDVKKKVPVVDEVPVIEKMKEEPKKPTEKIIDKKVAQHNKVKQIELELQSIHWETLITQKKQTFKVDECPGWFAEIDAYKTLIGKQGTTDEQEYAKKVQRLIVTVMQNQINRSVEVLRSIIDPVIETLDGYEKLITHSFFSGKDTTKFNPVAYTFFFGEPGNTQWKNESVRKGYGWFSIPKESIGALVQKGIVSAIQLLIPRLSTIADSNQGLTLDDITELVQKIEPLPELLVTYNKKIDLVDEGRFQFQTQAAEKGTLIESDWEQQDELLGDVDAHREMIQSLATQLGDLERRLNGFLTAQFETVDLLNGM